MWISGTKNEIKNRGSQRHSRGRQTSTTIKASSHERLRRRPRARRLPIKNTVEVGSGAFAAMTFARRPEPIGTCPLVPADMVIPLMSKYPGVVLENPENSYNFVLVAEAVAEPSTRKPFKSMSVIRTNPLLAKLVL